jgi:hypothetical protein
MKVTFPEVAQLAASMLLLVFGGCLLMASPVLLLIGAFGGLKGMLDILALPWIVFLFSAWGSGALLSQKHCYSACILALAPYVPVVAFGVSLVSR